MHKVMKYTQWLYCFNLYNQTRNDVGIMITTSYQLALFLDYFGTICVGGRLRHAHLDNKARHLILLPQKCHLTELIIQYYHRILLHGGARVVLSIISRQYWIISSRAVQRRAVYSRVSCSRYRASNP